MAVGRQSSDRTKVCSCGARQTCCNSPLFPALWTPEWELPHTPPTSSFPFWAEFLSPWPPSPLSFCFPSSLICHIFLVSRSSQCPRSSP